MLYDKGPQFFGFYMLTHGWGCPRPFGIPHMEPLLLGDLCGLLLSGWQPGICMVSYGTCGVGGWGPGAMGLCIHACNVAGTAATLLALLPLCHFTVCYNNIQRMNVLQQAPILLVSIL